MVSSGTCVCVQSPQSRLQERSVVGVLWRKFNCMFLSYACNVEAVTVHQIRWTMISRSMVVKLGKKHSVVAFLAARDSFHKDRTVPRNHVKSCSVSISWMWVLSLNLPTFPDWPIKTVQVETTESWNWTKCRNQFCQFSCSAPEVSLDEAETGHQRVQVRLSLSTEL